MSGEKGEKISGRESHRKDDEVLVRELGEKAASEQQAKWSDDKSNDIDDMLDEIDDVLEENAEEFVQAYKQKGGQ